VNHPLGQTLRVGALARETIRLKTVRCVVQYRLKRALADVVPDADENCPGETGRNSRSCLITVRNFYIFAFGQNCDGEPGVLRKLLVEFFGFLLQRIDEVKREVALSLNSIFYSFCKLLPPTLQFVSVLAVHVSEDNINAADGCDYIGDQVVFAHYP